MDPLTQGIMLYSVLLISLVVHEAAHAVTALWGGDRTAYLGGQVTLNPIPHMQREPFGTLILPILVLYLSSATTTMGFAHAPVDAMWARRHPKKAALMSAAGPISNFLLVLLAILVLKIMLAFGLVTVKLGYVGMSPIEDFIVPADNAQDGPVRAACLICSTFIILNLLLGFLNLLPVPPLDGAGVVGGFFPRTAGRFYDALRSNTLLSLVPMLLVFWFLINYGMRYLMLYPFDWSLKLIKLGQM